MLGFFHGQNKKSAQTTETSSALVPPAMNWIWPGESTLVSAFGDYHPRIGNGLEVVGGWGRTNNLLVHGFQLAVDSNDGNPYHTAQYYGVNGNDYIDFIFTFTNSNTWCSGYRQTGHNDWGTSTFTNEIEIYIADTIYGPWTLETSENHTTWHNHHINTFTETGAGAGTTTTWIPSKSSKYLRIRTLSNHGDTVNGGRITVRFLQLKIGIYEPPTMNWVWPSDSSMVTELNDYHPGYQGGLQPVGGWQHLGVNPTGFNNGLQTAGDPYASTTGYFSHAYYTINQNYIDFIFTFTNSNTWCSGFRQFGYNDYGIDTFINQIQIYITDNISDTGILQASDNHTTWHNGYSNIFSQTDTTTEWTPTAASKYLRVRILSNHSNGSSGFITARFLQIKIGIYEPPTMNWVWPSESTMVSSLGDYHPTVGNGEQVVGGNGFPLSLAADSANSYSYSTGASGVSGDDYIDFIFTFTNPNTWCSGYRQFGDVGLGVYTFTNEIEIYITNNISETGILQKSDNHTTWHNGSSNIFSNTDTTTEWTPTAPSKYLRVRTLSNHGYQGYGGRLSVRFLQLKIGI
jgi:hypothetical protein